WQRCKKIVTEAIVTCVITSATTMTCHHVSGTRPWARNSSAALKSGIREGALKRSGVRQVGEGAIVRVPGHPPGKDGRAVGAPPYIRAKPLYFKGCRRAAAARRTGRRGGR